MGAGPCLVFWRVCCGGVLGVIEMTPRTTVVVRCGGVVGVFARGDREVAQWVSLRLDKRAAECGRKKPHSNVVKV